MGESSRECENGYKVQIEYDVVNQCCRMGLFQRIVGNHIRICMCGCLSCAITIPTVKNLIYKLRLRSPQLGYSP